MGKFLLGAFVGVAALLAVVAAVRVRVTDNITQSVLFDDRLGSAALAAMKPGAPSGWGNLFSGLVSIKWGWFI